MARYRLAPVGVVLGGLLMAALYVPFRLTHGPTSVDLGNEVLGADMHVWGLLLGVVPCTVLGLALWRLRSTAAGARAVTRTAWTTVAAVLLLSAVQDLVFRALGPPLLYFVLVPALLVAAATHRSRRDGGPSVRAATSVLSALLLGGLAGLAFLPEITAGFGSYRLATFLLYGAGGLGWAALGIALDAAVEKGGHPA